MEKSEDPLDVAHLRRQTFDDRALEREILSLFKGQCARLMPLLMQPDSQETRDAAHTLKGAAGAVGAWRVAEDAQILEGDIQSDSKACENLARSVAKVLERIDDLLFS